MSHSILTRVRPRGVAFFNPPGRTCITSLVSQQFFRDDLQALLSVYLPQFPSLSISTGFRDVDVRIYQCRSVMFNVV